ncbi:MAG: pyrroloquinoline quinone-dependent dehydrogenase [Deltaproteobacteria bacterium]|nr:pyrroloquinoline quinone-dependent dehydrogenase [Deltaproteobacteria bacterium]
MFRRASLVVLAALALACSESTPDLTGPIEGWSAYGNDAGGSRYSKLTQITPDNVGDLELAWIHRSGDVLDGTGGFSKSSLQVTPIIAAGSLVYCSPRNKVFALDPETGAERWRFDPAVDAKGFYILNCRGVSQWTDPSAVFGAACRERIVMGTIDARLIELDARTGKPCAEFGAGGTVDLAAGIGDAKPGEYGVTSPPVIVRDRIVTGTMVLDSRRVDAPSGVVRAYDVRTGALAWAWDPIPPEHPGLAPRGEGVLYKRGTTNAWSALSVDLERGLVYVPTGNTSPDYYGGHREGADAYSASIVALDVNDGRVAWHFQTVHHDIWDYDIASQPVLFDFRGEGGAQPGLIAPTKLGMLFFLNRETGAPLFPIEERPVPQEGAVPGEYLAPTQPFTTKPEPLHPFEFGPDDAFGFTPIDKAACRRQIEALRHDGIYTPPSLEGSVQYPGYVGGMNWGSVAVDPHRRVVVTNVQRIAGRIQLVPQEDVASHATENPFGIEPQAGSPYALDRMPLLSPFGAPCTPPPWGQLIAIDTVTGEKKWEVTLGTTRDQAPFPIWLPIGTPNIGGPIATASGLVFIGATTDFYLRAFSTETGEEVWKRRLPTGAHATPMTYRLTPTGRQFVVVAAGGHGILGTPPNDALMAFALPQP